MLDRDDGDADYRPEGSGTYDDRIKSIGIVTDYSLHPFWEYTAMDYFVAAMNC